MDRVSDDTLATMIEACDTGDWEWRQAVLLQKKGPQQLGKALRELHERRSQCCGMCISWTPPESVGMYGRCKVLRGSNGDNWRMDADDYCSDWGARDGQGE